MPKYFALLPVLLGLIVAAIVQGEGPDQSKQDRPVRLACLGDSITKGEGTSDPAQEGYPAQLQEMLGSKWEVKNFGVGGRTLLRKQDPYNFNPALKWQPDVIVIMLGTNDSRQATWEKHGDEFIEDYKAVLKAFKGLTPKPTIYICCPPPMFPGNYGLADDQLTTKVIPQIRQVAEQEKVTLIDLHTPLAGQKDDFPDRVHPNASGAKQIAQLIQQAIAAPSPTSQPNQ
jgi:lysophospholipase L1-like esterase